MNLVGGYFLNSEPPNTKKNLKRGCSVNIKPHVCFESSCFENRTKFYPFRMSGCQGSVAILVIQ
jgi:hypothetical protein